MKIYTASATCELPNIVASLCEGNPLEKRIVFCEDKFTLALELAIARKQGGTFGTHVFSFNRYMHKKLAGNKKLLSSEGCALVLKSILLQCKNQLTCFKKVYDPNLASTVYELIAQLKSAKVTPEDIRRAMEESTGNLKRKLKDIHLLFDKYEEYIAQNGLTDGNNRLYQLPNHFINDEEIKGTRVIIAGFPSLNRTLCEIFKALLKSAKSVDFVVVAGDNSGVYTNETFNFINNLYPEAECERAVGESITKRLLNGLFNSQSLIEEGEYSSNIYLYKANDKTEEIRHVAQIIRRGVLAGASYKEYSLCAENIAEYELIIKRVFADYEIPFFYDGTKNLSKHPLTRLVCSYIDLVRRGFDISDLFDFVKNPLFEPNKRLTDAFENYCIGCSINRRTVKKSFTVQSEELNEFEAIRSKAVEVGDYIKEGMTFGEVVEGVYKMLTRVNAFENLKALSEKLGNMNRGEITAFNEQADEKFNGVVEDAVNLLCNLTLPLTEVKNVILSGMTACKVSVIPEYNDCVFVGDFRSVRYNTVNNLFAVGLTDGVPLSKIDSALLCDRDIARMERAKVLVEPKIKEVNRRAREVACMALATFKEHLYLSYPQALASGEEGKPSEIIKYVQAIFSDKKRQTKIFDLKGYKRGALSVGGEREKIFKIRNYLTERSSVFAFAEDVGRFKEGACDDFSAGATFYKVYGRLGKGETLDGVLTQANSQMGYYTEGVNYVDKGISATSIEGYFNCPYANFLQRGVKLTERVEFDLKANDLGNIVHEVGQLFVERVDWNCDKEEVVKLASQIFEEVIQIDEYRRHLSSAGGKRSFELIKKEAVRFCVKLFEASKHSKLKPKYLEVYFGGRRFPAITVNTKKGEMKVVGKIDRIDSDGENMTVIDYKTGKVEGSKADLNLYTGKKLQLFLYAKAFSDKFKAIGAYYFPISDKFKGDEDEAEGTYVGKTIADEERALLIDDTLDESGKSNHLNANFTRKKDGGYRYPGALLSSEEFEGYMEYSQQIAGAGLNEITEGVIVPSPYEGACSYCKYLGICGYDEESFGRGRKIEEISKEDILRAVGVKVEDSSDEGGE